MSKFETNDSSSKHGDNPAPLNIPVDEQFAAKGLHIGSDTKKANEHLPSLTLVDQSDNLVAGGHWSGYASPDGSAALHHVDLPGPAAADVDAPQTGEPVHIRFWARSDNSAPLEMSIMRSQAPYAPDTDESVNLTGQWKEYDFDAVLTTGTKLDMHFSTPGEADIKNVSVTPETPEQMGLCPGDLSPVGIQAHIDAFRKGNLHLTVLDKNGQPVPDADVEINQTRPDFLFGTEVQALHPGDTSPQQLQYQNDLKNTFNFATVTPYWFQTAGSDLTQQNFKSADQQISWLGNNGLDVKVHPAFWAHMVPKSLSTNPAEALPLINEHTAEFSQHFSQFPNVLFLENNEVASAMTDPGNNGAINWVKEVGAVKAVESQTAIEKGAMAAGGNVLPIDYNDWTNNDAEIKMLQGLQKDGKLPDAIGIQMHMTQGNWPLEKVEQIIDELAQFGKPIYISEISVLSGDHRSGDKASQKDWTSTAAGEQQQSQYVQELYKVLYSNPDVKGITWWDLTDQNSWLDAPRGLLRQDMSPKPAYTALHDLIKNDWETRENVTTDNHGGSQQRVFAGDYDIVVTEPCGKKVTQKVHVGAGQTDNIVIQES